MKKIKYVSLVAIFILITKLSLLSFDGNLSFCVYEIQDNRLMKDIGTDIGQLRSSILGSVVVTIKGNPYHAHPEGSRCRTIAKIHGDETISVQYIEKDSTLISNIPGLENINLKDNPQTLEGTYNTLDGKSVIRFKGRVTDFPDPTDPGKSIETDIIISDKK